MFPLPYKNASYKDETLFLCNFITKHVKEIEKEKFEQKESRLKNRKNIVHLMMLLFKNTDALKELFTFLNKLKI